VTINDFFGLRIVCPFLEDIETVSSLIASHFEILETERKANQHSFREFGYDSVHLAIPLTTQLTGRSMPGVRKVCEIQLRTTLQEAWAEVEHELVYKSDISLPNQSIRRKLASLNATLTLSDLIFKRFATIRRRSVNTVASVVPPLSETSIALTLLPSPNPQAQHHLLKLIRSH
jgi:putative GTP pyrophosphokinase